MKTLNLSLTSFFSPIRRLFPTRVSPTAIELKPSGAVEWLLCSARMQYKYSKKQQRSSGSARAPRTIAISTAFGIKIDESCLKTSGSSSKSSRPIRYDKYTGSAQEFDQQATETIKSVQEKLEHLKSDSSAWKNIAWHEKIKIEDSFNIGGKKKVVVKGVPDIIILREVSGKNQLVVVDIKTGRYTPQKHFLQVGLYLKVLEKGDFKCPDNDGIRNKIKELVNKADSFRGIILWSPRGHHDKTDLIEQEGESLLRQSGDFIKAMPQLMAEDIERPCDYCIGCPKTDCPFSIRI